MMCKMDVEISHHHSVSIFRKQKRAANPGISVCSRIIRFMNNQKNSQRKTRPSYIPFYSLAEEWALPVTSIQEPEETESVVDSGACMHMVSKRDLNSVELETMRTSRSPTTVMRAYGEVQNMKQAT